MKVAIMQPYIFPYIGYFQLINAVDEFIVYDNIQFTKKGWINRNRILVNGSDSIFTLPLKKSSTFITIKDKFLADTWEYDRNKLLNRIHESYHKAPNFKETFEIVEKCLWFDDRNLFNFTLHSIETLMHSLEIDTKVRVSSTIFIDNQLKGEEKVIAICKECFADVYINPTGGISLYDKERFNANNIDLKFQKSNIIIYPQFDNEFVTWLSILDVLMFNDKVQIKNFLNNYKLI